MYLQRGRARSSSPLLSSLFPHVRGRLLRAREIRVCLRPHLGLTRHSLSRLGDSADERGLMSTRRIAYAAVLAALYIVIGQLSASRPRQFSPSGWRPKQLSISSCSISPVRY